MTIKPINALYLLKVDSITMKKTSPLMIAVAPNGARKNKADHPALPITPKELADTASRCLDAGACMIHLHVRDKNNAHTLDVDAYRTAIAAIRSQVGAKLIVQVTSEAVGIYQAEQQMAMVRELKPQAVSLALRELCPDAQHEIEAARFFKWLNTEQIIPQYILYNEEDVHRFNQLRKREIIPGDMVSALLVLGRYQQKKDSSPADLLPLLSAFEVTPQWSVCAFGASEGGCMITAAGLGGHCRIGFENNMQLITGEIASGNEALVNQIAANAQLVGRRPASAAEALELMNSN